MCSYLCGANCRHQDAGRLQPYLHTILLPARMPTIFTPYIPTLIFLGERCRCPGYGRVLCPAGQCAGIGFGAGVHTWIHSVPHREVREGAVSHFDPHILLHPVTLLPSHPHYSCCGFTHYSHTVSRSLISSEIDAAGGVLQLEGGTDGGSETQQSALQV